MRSVVEGMVESEVAAVEVEGDLRYRSLWMNCSSLSQFTIPMDREWARGV